MHGRCHYKKAAFMGGGSCWILLMAQQEGGAGVASARKVAHPKRARPDGGRLEGVCNRHQDYIFITVIAIRMI
jgi:hypothetical protein